MKLRTTCLAIVLTLGCVHTAQAQPKEREASAVDPATRDRSRAAFRKGVTQLRAQDYNGARASFEEAYALVQHPSILLNLGIAHLKTGDPVLAETDLLHFLQEDGGASPEELASARETLVEAKKQIGTLKVVATPPTAKVTVDGAALTLKDGTVDTRLKAGAHAVTVEADGFAPMERTVEIPAKGEAKLEATLTTKGATPPSNGDKGKDPSKDDSSLRPIAGYGLAGVSGVALIVTTVLGLKALSASSDYADKGNKDTYRNPETKDSGTAARTGADVALVVALLAGAGAVILLFTDIGASHEPPATTPKASALTPRQSWYGPSLRSGSPALIRW